MPHIAGDEHLFALLEDLEKELYGAVVVRRQEISALTVMGAHLTPLSQVVVEVLLALEQGGSLPLPHKLELGLAVG